MAGEESEAERATCRDILQTMWTLYKNFQPDLNEQPELAEYYQLRLIPQREGDHPTYRVEENHGWFDDLEKKAKHHIRILAPEDSFQTWDEAMVLVRQQMLHLVGTGFVHQLTFDPFAPRYYRHEVLDPAKLSREAEALSPTLSFPRSDP